MQIGITVSNENYHKAITLRQDRKLSGLLDSFLTNYFAQEEEISDLVNAEIELEKEKEIKQNELNGIITKLTVIKIKIESEREERSKEEQETLNDIEIKQETFKRSGIMEEVLNSIK